MEEAEIKGHYLILTWTEFANLEAPPGKKQRGSWSFSARLVAGTANVSLTSRMVTGKPADRPKRPQPGGPRAAGSPGARARPGWLTAG